MSGDPRLSEADARRIMQLAIEARREVRMDPDASEAFTELADFVHGLAYTRPDDRPRPAVPLSSPRRAEGPRRGL